VIAPLLIVQQVTNRSALTSDTITTGGASSYSVRRQGEPTGGDGIPLGDHPKNSVAGDGKDAGDPGVAVEKTTGFHPDGSV